MKEWISHYLAGLGLVVLLYVITTIATQIIRGFRAHLTLNKVPFTTKFGKWAVVTGSTDGIGRAYAFELAKRGVNLVLISRSQEKLDSVAADIRKQYLVRTKTIAADFSEGEKIFTKIKEELKDVEIGILVNNVGKQYEYPMFLAELPEKELWDIININIGATTLMTSLALKKMLKNGKGAIVNISSAAEETPLPLMTVYAASKTFIKSFSAALKCEYESQGITVQHLSPFFVNTKMNHFSNRLQQSSFVVPDATTYAEGAVNTLGKVAQSSGCLSHGIQAFLVSFTPMSIRIYIGWTLNVIFRRDYHRQLMCKQG